MPRKFTIEDVKQYFKNEGYTLLDNEYISIKTKMKSICPNGEVFIVNFDKFKHGQRCKCNKCYTNPRKFSYDFIKGEFEKEGYQLLSNEYLGTDNHLVLKCPKGHIVKISYSKFRSGTRCSECCHNKKYTVEEVKEYMESFNYELLSKEYKNVFEKLIIKCLKVIYMILAIFITLNMEKDVRYVMNQKGEKKISEILDKLNIEYIQQYKFDDCKGKRRRLPFDFYLPKYNCCIEYDGKQHFEVVEFNGCSKEKAEESYILVTHNDIIKNSYCRDNNIKLIRIPYWDYDNIEDIIKHELK